MNFLVHNMCRRPGSDGTWMIVPGGMGTVPAILARELERHGARIVTSAPVGEIVVRDGRVHGVRLRDGRELVAKSVVSVPEARASKSNTPSSSDNPGLT